MEEEAKAGGSPMPRPAGLGAITAGMLTITSDASQRSSSTSTIRVAILGGRELNNPALKQVINIQDFFESPLFEILQDSSRNLQRLMELCRVLHAGHGSSTNSSPT